SEPSIRPGMCRTSQAPIGAAITPPINMTTTHDRSMPARPSPTRNPALLATTTANSAALTDPTTMRGSSWPDASSADVPIGPHPPPPVEFMNPPTSPTGARKLDRNDLVAPPDVPQMVNLIKMYNPRARRISAISGRATATDSLLKNVAPA